MACGWRHEFGFAIDAKPANIAAPREQQKIVRLFVAGEAVVVQLEAGRTGTGVRDVVRQTDVRAVAVLTGPIGHVRLPNRMHGDNVHGEVQSLHQCGRRWSTAFGEKRIIRLLARYVTSSAADAVQF